MARLPGTPASLVLVTAVAVLLVCPSLCQQRLSSAPSVPSGALLPPSGALGQTADESIKPRKGPKKALSGLHVSKKVTRHWGVPDMEAVVGRTFSFRIPEDAFSGPVTSYSVSSLPPWLQWEPSLHSIVGVPPRGAAGRQHLVAVAAHGPSGTAAKDTFAVTARRDAGPPSPECGRLVTLVAASWDSLSPVGRVAAAAAFAAVTGLEQQAVSVTPVRGPGSRRQRGAAANLELKATVPCSSLTRITDLRLTGPAELTQLMPGSPAVLAWRMITPHHASAPQPHPRAKRSPQDTGEYDYPAYDYNYDYEYDDYDPNEADYSGAEQERPDERVVPSLATPTPALPPSAPPTLGGDSLLPPVLRPVPISTPVYVPVKPTRVVVEPSPTLVSPPPTRTALPTDAFFPPHRTIQVEPTRPLAPSTSVTATEPLPPSGPATTAPGGGEVTDHLVRNFPPEVNRRIDKLAWVAGFVYRVQVPVDTFNDLEDGDTRNLRLVLLDSDLTQLGPHSWIQFDPVTQTIYALPLEDHMGQYTFLLEAIDSGGKNVRESVKIHVHQPKQARNYHHRYTATMRIAKKFEYEFTFSLDWQIRVVEKIVALFDNSTDSINVRSISSSPTRVVWTNVTTVDGLSNTCPDPQLDHMNEVLFGTSSPSSTQHEPARDVVESFKPEFHLKRLHVHYSPPCDERQRRPNASAAPPSASPRNKDPYFTNQIDIVNATAGLLYRRQVPSDTCYDMEDGNSRNLRLRLLTHSLQRLPLNNWLQFDINNQEFYGLPLAEDVGSVEYTLECVDSSGGKANDALTVVVRPSPSGPSPPATFSLTLDHDYLALMSQPQHKAMLVTRLGTAFGDTDGRLVSVVSLSPGSVVVAWTNSSLGGGGPCPQQELQRLHDTMLASDGSVRPEFSSQFLEEFVVLEGSVTPGGSCLSPDTPLHVPPPDLGSEDVFGFDDVRGEQSEGAVRGGQTPPEDYLLTFLVPSVLMAAMLVLAAVAACCLYRHRRRYAKMSLTQHATPPDTTTFVTTGIPVILAEEMDEQQQQRTPLAKTPVIMRDEKPPLPPYSRQSPPPSNPPTGQRRSGEHQQPPYQQPPPPFTNGRSSPRAAHPPAYRKPTYMPP